MLAEVFGAGITHEAPAADVFHSGKHRKKSIGFHHPAPFLGGLLHQMIPYRPLKEKKAFAGKFSAGF
ncbi:MAG: hypothetical protein ACLVL7_11770 [Anaerotruncus massiliensis (ex Togo et al. 2019)]